MTQLKAFLKIIVTLTVYLVLTLLFTQILILVLTYLNFDLFRFFSAHCVEYQRLVDNRILSTSCQSNEVSYVVKRETNVYVYSDTVIEDIERDEPSGPRSCTKADVKRYTKWIVPLSVVGGIWSYYWSKWVWHLVFG